MFARWQAANGRATDAPFTVYHEGGGTTVRENQEQNNNTWMSLGTYVLAPGQNHRVVLGDDADGYVTADAVKFVPADEASVTWPIASVAESGNYLVYAKWPASPANASDAAYTVTDSAGAHIVTVDQRVNGGGQWNLLGTYSFDAATPGYQVALSAAANGTVAADAIYYVPDTGLPDTFTWAPALPAAGDYAVYARWPGGVSDAGTALYTIGHDGGVSSRTISQQTNGGQWVWLGTYAMDPANNPQVALTAAGPGAIYADAMRFVSGDAIGGAIEYSHSDQIGAIQKLTDATGALVWDRTQRPFGETVSTSAASGVDQKLRFPGQYADETGLSYNYFRDYDPTLGRYSESDPTGLSGGINTYAYVAGSPLNHVDPSGLLTLQIGGSVSIDVGGAHGGAGAGIAIDDNGNVGIYWNWGGGPGAGVGGSAGISLNVSDGDTICDLKDWFLNFGGGIGAGPDLGGEVFVGQGQDGQDVTGVGVTVGAGVGGGVWAGPTFTGILPILSPDGVQL